MLRSVAILAVAFAAIAVTAIPTGKIRSEPPKSGHRSQSDHQHPDDWQMSAASARQALPVENSNDYWLKKAQDFVQTQRDKPTLRKRAKNVIMFLGDGMSLATVAAARPYVHGEQTDLHFEQFPVVGTAKTYCVNYQVSDSASTATAYLGGVKANYGTVGVTAAVARYNCTAQLDPANQVRSIAAWAQAAGKWTGFVTTSQVTDASPAGLYAHSANRYWENDVELKSRCTDERAEDIARQLVNGEVGAQMRVVMGGGRSEFRGVDVADEEKGNGLRQDGRNLIAEWANRRSGERAEYVWNATHLRSLDASKVDHLLGLFEPAGLKYHREITAEGSEEREPTLTEMTLKAIEILSRNPDGFYLFVENGKIDSAHHGTYARLALDETAELAKAVAAAQAALPADETLIVVTADHSHTMSYNGYPYRGNDITGMVVNSSDDGLPYMTLSYANGPGYTNQWKAGNGRVNLTEVDTSPLRFRYPSTVPTNSETHAGDDVGVWATGPWSHLFRGNYEQHVLPHLMAFASCMNGNTGCDSGA